MSEREKKIIESIAENEKKLDAEDKAYICGVIDGMVTKSKKQKGEEK